jgi:BirA family biotin operon repressor/biotin-[acetyl-CoA-carboxylase] ligase
LITEKKLQYLVECYRQEDSSLLSIAKGIEYAKEIVSRGCIIGHRIHYTEHTERLMPIARDTILEHDRQGRDFPSGVVWWAGSLGASRGRMTRTWWAPTGGIYICISFFPELIKKNRGLYSIAAGVALAGVLRNWGANAEIRWINDILLNEKKIAGILAESVTCNKSEEEFLLLGMGINVNIPSFPKELPFASSLLIETGNTWPVYALGAHIISRASLLFAELHKWEADNIGETGETEENPLIKHFRLLSGSIGRKVVYGNDADANPEIRGKVLDIAADGSLIIAANNEQLALNSGEIRYID